MTHPDGQAFSYQYDGLNRPTGIYAGPAASGTALVAFAYDNFGRRIGTARGGGDASSYGYDAASRLNSLAHSFTGGAGNVTTSFTYNPASQISSRSISNDAYAYTGDVNVSRNYARNGLNQYMSAGPATLGYDANGNLTASSFAANPAESVTYIYDAENRLISASGANSANLRYDPLGRLSSISGASAVNPTHFLYDGDALIGEYDTNGALLRRYVHGNEDDDPYVWYEGAGLAAPQYLHANHQGSILAIAGASGSVTRINSYDAWGIPDAQNQGRFQYTGQAWLPELGLYHYKARIYSPTLGRFLQTDPIGYEDQMGLYAYVANDPVNGRDPKGTETYSAGIEATAVYKGGMQVSVEVSVDTESGELGVSGEFSFRGGLDFGLALIGDRQPSTSAEDNVSAEGFVDAQVSAGPLSAKADLYRVKRDEGRERVSGALTGNKQRPEVKGQVPLPKSSVRGGPQLRLGASAGVGARVSATTKALPALKAKAIDAAKAFLDRITPCSLKERCYGK